MSRWPGHVLKAKKFEVWISNGTLARWDGIRFTWQRKTWTSRSTWRRSASCRCRCSGQVDQMIKWFHADDVTGLLYTKKAPHMGKKYSGKPIAAKN